jgi:hypothetical protein
MEASVSVRGSAKGIPINGSITYVTGPSSPGVLRGKAQGVLTSEELEMVTFTAEGRHEGMRSGILEYRINRQTSLSKRCRWNL